jgi:hypothetical protein
MTDPDSTGYSEIFLALSAREVHALAGSTVAVESPEVIKFMQDVARVAISALSNADIEGRECETRQDEEHEQFVVSLLVPSERLDLALTVLIARFKAPLPAFPVPGKPIPTVRVWVP